MTLGQANLKTHLIRTTGLYNSCGLWAIDSMTWIKCSFYIWNGFWGFFNSRSSQTKVLKINTKINDTLQVLIPVLLPIYGIK